MVGFSFFIYFEVGQTVIQIMKFSNWMRSTNVCMAQGQYKKELQDNPSMYPSVLTNIDLIFFKIVHHTFHIKI
jgi:hypothetical protein